MGKGGSEITAPSAVVECNILEVLCSFNVVKTFQTTFKFEIHRNNYVDSTGCLCSKLNSQIFKQKCCCNSSFF